MSLERPSIIAANPSHGLTDQVCAVAIFGPDRINHPRQWLTHGQK